MKKAVLRALLFALLACLLVLPMTLMVGAESQTVWGYCYVDRFKTDWAGSSITSGAAWGYKWVRSDGTNFGSVLIPNTMTTGDQVTLSSGGRLSFWGTDAKCKLQPTQLSGNALQSGPALMKFSLQYDPDTFSGFEIAYIPNSEKTSLLSIAEDGAVRAGSSRTDTGFELAEGYNDVYLYLLPTYSQVDSTTQTGVTAYLAVRNKNRGVADTRGVTVEHLKALPEVYYEFDYTVTVSGGYADLAALCANLWMYALDGGNCGYTIYDMEYYNLQKDELYAVVYEGYPELNAYVGVADASNVLTLPYLSGRDVVCWRVVRTDGTVQFYVDGSFIEVTSSMTVTEANDSELELAAAIRSAKEDLPYISTYYYQYVLEITEGLRSEMQSFLSSGGTTDNPCYVQAAEVLDLLNSEINRRKTPSDALIAYAAIFSNPNEDMLDRLEAYEGALALNGTYDSTYVDVHGNECQTAIDALEDVTPQMSGVKAAYDEYRENVAAFEGRTTGADDFLLFERAYQSYLALSEYFSAVPFPASMEPFRGAWLAVESAAAEFDPTATNARQLLAALEQCLARASQLGDVENTAATVIARGKTVAENGQKKIERAEQINAEMAELLGGWDMNLSIEELYRVLYDAIELKLSSWGALSQENRSLLEDCIEEYNALVRVYNEEIKTALYLAETVAGTAEDFETEAEVAAPPPQYTDKKRKEEQV